MISLPALVSDCLIVHTQHFTEDIKLFLTCAPLKCVKRKCSPDSMLPSAQTRHIHWTKNSQVYNTMFSYPTSL